MKNPRNFAAASLIALAAALGATPFVISAAHADALLTGTITSTAGEKMGGVTVSAKAERSPITTSVFTDEAGNYYFPPLPNGKYRVWAQALTYQTANGNAELHKTTRRDFVLQPIRTRRIGSGNCPATSSSQHSPATRRKTIG